MNTISEENAKNIAKQSGRDPIKVIVQTRTLEQILDEHLPAGQRIDFLTVDVENNNLSVLKSNNWEKYKPLIVLVEVDNDCLTLEAISNSEMVAFMKKFQYQIVAWIKPTLIFKMQAPDGL